MEYLFIGKLAVLTLHSDKTVLFNNISILIFCYLGQKDKRFEKSYLSREVSLYFPCCFVVQIMHKDGPIMNNCKLIFFDLPEERVHSNNFFVNFNGNIFEPGFKFSIFFSDLMKLKFNGALHILLHSGIF